MDPKKSRLAWQKYLSICMSSYKKATCIADKIPHPNLLCQLDVDQVLSSQLLELYDGIPYQPISYKYDKTYKAPSKPNTRETYEVYMRHKSINKDVAEKIQKLFNDLQPNIENKLGYHVAIVNVRFFDLNKGMPEKWHVDNFPCGIYKVLVYLNGAGNEIGSTQIIINNKKILIKSSNSTAILFDSNNLPHTSLAPVDGSRKTIEFTVAPSLFSSSKIIQPGLLATYPLLPPEDLLFESRTNNADDNSINQLRKFKDIYLFNQKNSQKSPHSLNVGGGPNFFFEGWANLDGAFGMGNHKPFKFTPKCYFPFEDNSFKQVISSHTLEHLDDPTTHRVLQEISRVCKKNALLLIKIPCFGEMLRDYHENKFEQWRFITKEVEKFWACKNVATNDLNRISFAFCNFWNTDYGSDHYEGVSPGENAYFGPVYDISPEEIANVLKSNDCHFIANHLYEKSNAMKSNSERLGHINAWSESQMNSLLEKYNFSIVSNDKYVIASKLQNWPKIQKHFKESSWHLCKKLD